MHQRWQTSFRDDRFCVCREYVIGAICSHVTCSGSSRVKSSDGSRRAATGEPGCCARARWGEEPRDRDLFISRRARVRSYILPLLPPSPPIPPPAPPAHNLFLRFSLSLRDFLLLRLYPPVLSAVA
ncbi:hypothetical protein ALC53_04949 [Atta colombica]|uniref:Uncharacterized protein n=1 Tax=Atta colombica TaxID=520822 RepID=A0A195BJ84_9HYME|nr:hypothetical protein ALC53_04949 [Atta colombica]